MDISVALKNLIRDGIVSSTDPATMTARVTFPDRDDLVSYPLEVLSHGSQDNKHYWMPGVGEQVLCLFLPQDNNLSQGYILGTTYNAKDSPLLMGRISTASNLRTARPSPMMRTGEGSLLIAPVI